MNRLLRVGAFLACLTLFAAPVHAADNAALNREEASRLLRQILQDEPEIILDVLREHSEMVLDIAQQGSNQRRLKNLQSQWMQELDTTRPIALGDRPVRGKMDAPVTIVAFSDFTCPYCTQAAGMLDRLIEDNPERLRLIFKHFPLEGHRFARMAAEYHVAASFQGTEKAWAFYDALFRSGKDVNGGGEELLKKTAESAGLDMKKLAADLKNKASQIRAVIDEDIADGKSLGLQGTPNFLVNNLIVRGSMSKDLFNQAVIMAYDHAMQRKSR